MIADATMLAPFAVREVFFHCGKALICGRLWDADTRIERSRLPRSVRSWPTRRIW